jgi:hypothetical protein
VKQNLSKTTRNTLSNYFQKVAKTGKKYDELTLDTFIRDACLLPTRNECDTNKNFLVGRIKVTSLQPRRFALNKDFKLKRVLEKKVPEISIFKRNVW